MNLQFTQLLAQAAPPEDDIYDIVVLAPKDSFWPLIIWSTIALLILAMLGALLWYFLKGNRSAAPQRSPESKALARLSAARRDQADSSVNEYAMALSEALKDYFAEKFEDPIRFETTQEFLNRIATEQARCPAAAQQHLQTFLVRADEVKFGNASDAEKKAAPLGKTAEQIIQLCHVVNETDTKVRQ
ncbi:MAG: DUF4381 family protein [Verrucomicrobiales bacterium]|nr:DUF4381 family protein [Verrucomicrobiales bacterium]